MGCEDGRYSARSERRGGYTTTPLKRNHGLKLREVMDAEIDICELIQCPLAKYLQRSCPRCDRYVGNRGARMEGQDASAGDQWTLPEMWLSARVGIGSEHN
jgi:hypothetical protein